MPGWIIGPVVLAILAVIFGFGMAASVFATIAKILFFVFLIALAVAVIKSVD